MQDILSLSTFKEVQKIKDSTNIYTLYLLKDGKIASCSDDKTIKIYNPANKFKNEMTIKGHSKAVYYVSQLDNGNLISCSADLTIKIWEIGKSYKCIYTIEKAHTKDINEIIPLPNSIMASCSDDMTINIRSSLPPYDSIKIINASPTKVKGIFKLSTKDILFAAVDDEYIGVYDLTTYTPKSNIKLARCCYFNSYCELKNNRVAFGGSSGVYIVDTEMMCICTVCLDEYMPIVFSLCALDDGNILMGCDEGFLSIFDLGDNYVGDIKPEMHEDGITTILKLDNGIFVTSSIDGIIKIWNSK